MELAPSFPRALDLANGQSVAPTPIRFEREPRHDCHCVGAMYWPDATGLCGNCGRFPANVVGGKRHKLAA